MLLILNKCFVAELFIAEQSKSLEPVKLAAFQ